MSFWLQILDKEETDEGGSGSDHTAHPEGEHESEFYILIYHVVLVKEKI